MIFEIYDNAVDNVDDYVSNILSGGFIDFNDGDKTFKGLQPMYNDPLSKIIKAGYPDCIINTNFVRKSPFGQDEPNFIHTDEMMGDLTAILYLTKNEMDGDGTTIYNEDETPMCVAYAKYNRLFIFDSRLKHSRNIFDNFGDGDDSRLIQVAFIKL
jgi:hypothetical protein